ncbi:MAG: HAMP domain-containing protein, partial [Chloroflexi bacterium]|nr:HAMP domain-containing protein [Chloroflexota bacterium]
MLRLSLRSKLLIGIFLILLPILALLFHDFRADYDRRTQAVLASQTQTAEAASALVDATFGAGLDVAWALTADPIVRSFDPARIDPHLRQLKSLYPQFDSIAVFDARGRNVGSAQMVTEPRLNVADRDYFQKVMSTNSPFVSNVLISRTTGRFIVVMAVPMRGDDGRPNGVVFTALNVDIFPRLLTEVRLQPGQTIFLADPTGRLAFDTEKPELTWDERDVSSYPPIRSTLEGRPFAGTDVGGPLGGEPSVVTTTSSKYGWVIGLSVPSRLAFAQVASAVRDKLIGYVAVALLGIALALLVARYLLQPLRELTANALALGRGDLQRRVRIKTGDELETLGDSFNTMADELQRMLRLREEFLLVASHELKTPLTVIKGYIQWLMRDEPNTARLKTLETMLRHANKMAELIGEMLQVSQIQAGPLEIHKEKLDVAGLAQKVAERMQGTTEKHRLLLCSAGPVWVEADQE